MKLKLVIMLILPLLIFLFAFGPAFINNEVVEGDDFRYSGIISVKQTFSEFGLDKHWRNYQLLGSHGSLKARLPVLSQIVTSGNLSSLLPLILAIILCFWGAYFYLENKVATFTNIIVSLVVSFSPFYYTFISAGHLGKLYVPGFFLFCLGFMERAIKTNYLMRSLILMSMSGLSLGLCFAHGETQVGLYMSIVLSLYFLIVIIQPKRIKLFSLGVFFKKSLLFLLIPTVAVIVSWSTLESQFSNYVLGQKTATIPVKEGINSGTEQGWEWATQWSLPLEESIELIMPGFFGLSSFSEDKPYWGKIGRGETYEAQKPRSGLRNYSGVSNYVGFGLFIGLFLGIIYLKGRFKWFWLSVIFFSLALSWGKYFPLYYLFYQLPLMDKFRVPLKFLEVFHLASIPIVALGFQAFFQSLNFSAINEEKLNTLNGLGLEFSDNTEKNSKKLKRSLLLFLSIGVLAFVCFLIFSPSFKEYFQSFNPINIVDKYFSSSLQAIVFFTIKLAIVYLLIHWVVRKTNISSIKYKWIFGLLFLFFLFESQLVNNQYINFSKSHETEYSDRIASNLKDIQSNFPSRYAMHGKNQYMNYFLFANNMALSLETLEVAAISRWPAPIKTFMDSTQKNLIRRWQMANVSVLLSPREINHPYLGLLDQIQLNPNNNVFMYQNKVALPKLHFTGQLSLKETFSELFTTMNAPSYNPGQTALSLNEYFKTKPDLDASNFNGTINFERLDSSTYKAKIRSATGGVLILNDHFSDAWSLKGISDTKHFPVNYIFNGWTIPPGEYEVELNARKVDWHNWLLLLSYCLFIIGIAYSLGLFGFNKKSKAINK